MEKNPILIIAHSRYDLLQKLLESNFIDDRKVYIYIDGAKNIDSGKEVIQTIQVAELYSKKNLLTQIRIGELNLGVKYGPIAAIDWAFETEKCLIILEDDIVITKEFLDFCQNQAKITPTKNG
jgi:hypothetical protein